MATTGNGDLNNISSERIRFDIAVDPAYKNKSWAISVSEDDPIVRKNYRPYLRDEIHDSSPQDWISELELSTVLKMVHDQVLHSGADRLRVLVLHGSMRKRYASYQRAQTSYIDLNS